MQNLKPRNETEKQVVAAEMLTGILAITRVNPDESAGRIACNLAISGAVNLLFAGADDSGFDTEFRAACENLKTALTDPTKISPYELALLWVGLIGLISDNRQQNLSTKGIENAANN